MICFQNGRSDKCSESKPSNDDELRNGNFRKIAMRLIPDQSHRENVAQRGGDQVGMLADEQLEPIREVFVGSAGVHRES